MLGKRKGLFGSPGTTAFAEMVQGVGTPDPMTNQPVDLMQAPEMKPAKPGFNDPGGWGEKLAMIGSVLAGDGGNSPALAPYILRRQQELLAQRQQQEREYDWQDWQRKQEWEAAHRPPAAPHYWETNDGSLAMVGPDGQPKVLYKDPTPKTEYQTVRNPDGTITVYPMPQVGGANTAPKVIGSQLPPGWTVEGGSGGNVGGGFR